MKERIIEFLAYLKIGQKNFEQKCGLSNGFVDKIGDTIRKKSRDKIIAVYPELSINWLLTGRGEMLNTKDESLTTEPTTENYKLVPLYNFDAVGGMRTSNDIVDCKESIEKYIPFIDAQSMDICIPITGNSMIPAYNPGSIVLLREVVRWREYFGYGHVFVLCLKDGRRIIKEVRKSEENSKDNILCISYNYQSSAPEDLPKEMIDRVYKVIKVLTNEGF